MSSVFGGPKSPNIPNVTEVEEDDEEERRRRARELATRGRRSTILTAGGPQEAVVSRKSLLGG